MVGDHFGDRWKDKYPQIPPTVAAPAFQWPVISRDEFEALKKEVELMKGLLIRAKLYDEENKEPHCEMDEKVALLKKVAEAVGVDLSEIFNKSK